VEPLEDRGQSDFGPPRTLTGNGFEPEALVRTREEPASREVELLVESIRRVRRRSQIRAGERRADDREVNAGLVELLAQDLVLDIVERIALSPDGPAPELPAPRNVANALKVRVPGENELDRVGVVRVDPEGDLAALRECRRVRAREREQVAIQVGLVRLKARVVDATLGHEGREQPVEPGVQAGGG
jgi:hypothetical protein